MRNTSRYPGNPAAEGAAAVRTDDAVAAAVRRGDLETLAVIARNIGIEEFRRRYADAAGMLSKPLVGEFITVPAWQLAVGQIIDQRPASLGSDAAIEVLVESKPEDPRPRWYRLEPTEFSFLLSFITTA